MQPSLTWNLLGVDCADLRRGDPCAASWGQRSRADAIAPSHHNSFQSLLSPPAKCFCVNLSCLCSVSALLVDLSYFLVPDIFSVLALKASSFSLWIFLAILTPMWRWHFSASGANVCLSFCDVAATGAYAFLHSFTRGSFSSS